MYVCICNALTEEDIKNNPNNTLAGTCCGTCLPDVDELLGRVVSEEEGKTKEIVHRTKAKYTTMIGVGTRCFHCTREIRLNEAALYCDKTADAPGYFCSELCCKQFNERC